MRVLIVSGGGSSEREVSLRSGRAVGQALMAVGHDVTYFDPGDDSTFESLRKLVLDTDVVFPLLHGRGGEDGRIQIVLDELEVAYVGSDAATSANCFDKAITLGSVHAAGILAPVTDVVDYKHFKRHPLIKRPFVVKPVNEGSSVDTYLIRDVSNFRPEAFEPLLKKYGTMLVQALVPGIEMTVAVLDRQALPVIEIVPPEGQNFDYANKYNGQTQELVPAQHIPDNVQRHAREIALNVHRLMQCRHYSRTDLIWAPDGQLYFLEVNTIPGMTDQSLFPKAAAAAGIELPQLTDMLVKMASRH